MQILKTGLQIGQAVKNAQRLRHIAGIFAKYGFADVVVRMNLGKYLPARLVAFASGAEEASTPERLRKAFEELGPTFVKLGQLLSTRHDLLPEAFIEEFTRLQDNVHPMPSEVARSVVERELKRKITDIFADFSSDPIAAASIGQVHSATLPGGEKVVVKIQRPEIEKMIETDISILAFIAGLLERYVPETRIVSPTIIVEEFFRTLSFELDFVIEANNMVRMSENLASIPEVVIPKVYRNMSTHKVLVLERLEGIRVNDIKAIDAAGISRKQVVSTGARAFFKSILIDGLFHGDLHGGNLFILPGNKLGMIDFGIVGRLSERSRDLLANMVMALMAEDFENLCYYYAELGTVGPSVDFEGFQREVRNTLSPYLGLSLEEINAGKILIESTKIATKYSIKVPGDWMLVFKAIVTIEGMGRTLDPSFDLMSHGRELVRDLVKNQYSVQRISKDLLWVSKDVATLLQILPRQIRWMFRKFNADDFAFEIKSPDLQALTRQLDVNGRRMSWSVLAVGLLLTGALSLQHTGGARWWDYPALSVIALVLGFLVLLRTLWGPK